MRLLVCGGAGFVGSAFIRNHLKTNIGDQIVNLDSLTTGSNLANLHEIEKNPNYTFVQDDIRNLDGVIKLAKDCDIMVNFAAESHVDRSISNPRPFIETNVLGTYSLLEAARKLEKPIIHISTDEVYGSTDNNESFTEDNALRPSNPYSATKASADLLIMSYFRTYGIKYIITRCTNNFGPFQFPEKLIPKTIIRAIKNLEIPLHGGGYPVRSWIYVLDHVQAIESLIEKGKWGQIYNIAGKEFTNRTIIEKILKLLKKPSNLMMDVEDRPGQDKRYSLNALKIHAITGWIPHYDFDESLKETVNWYVENTEWWMPLANENVLHPQQWNV